MALPNQAGNPGGGQPAPPQLDPVEVRRRLEELRRRLLDQMGHLQETIAEDYAGGPGPVDRWEHSGYGDHLADDGTAVFERERSLGQEQDYREHLRLVQHALYKLDTGTYGLCDVCGRPIDPERLQALPETNLCIVDKQKQERRGGLTGIPHTV